MPVIDIDTDQFSEKVIARSHQVPVVVDFWAEWCGPCRVLGPTLERLANEADGAWELAKVDVDANPQLAMQFGVQGIPTVIGFRDGQPLTRFTGALPEAQIRGFLDQLLPSELDLRAADGQRALDGGDAETAEAAFRQVLDADPGHLQAGLGLGRLLVDRGEPESALEVLAKLAPTDEVRQLQAAARLAAAGDLDDLAERAASGDPGARLDHARALAAAGRYEDALPSLIELVEARGEGTSEEARQAMLDAFEVLGQDHPLTVQYRRRLASALF